MQGRYAKAISQTIHFLLMAMTTYLVPYLRNIHSPWFSIYWYFLFRLVTLIAFLAYFITGLRDPGYVPLQDPIELEPKARPARNSSLNTVISSKKNSVTAPSTNTSSPYISVIKHPDEDLNISRHAISLPPLHEEINDTLLHQSVLEISPQDPSRLDVSMSASSDCNESDYEKLSVQDPESLNDQLQAQSVLSSKRSDEKSHPSNFIQRASTEFIHPKSEPSSPSEVSIDCSSEQDQDQDIKIEVYSAESPPTHAVQISEEFEITELRFCTVCHIDQPIRAKHCKVCDRCVETFDHHCSWLGNCIGERNRCVFYWYLVIQGCEASLAVCLLCLSIGKEEDIPWAVYNVPRIVLAVIIAGGWGFVVFLIVMHSYMALENLTTWEIVSWKKISYLNNWEKALGSPFSMNLVGNLKYFCSWKSVPRVWRVPSCRDSRKITCV